MSDDELAPPGDTENSEAKRSTPIVRSPSWTRLSADQALFFVLGHDAEICFTTTSPYPVETLINVDEEGEEVSESFRLENRTEEVVRIRIPPISAVTLAFNIIARQASNDVFEKEKLEEQFRQILSLVPSNEEDSPDE